MKIALISDTHDNTPAVVWIIQYLNQHSIQTTFHAGDLINPGILHRFLENYQGKLHFVFGNNDGEQSKLTQMAEASDQLVCHNRDMVLELEDKHIFMNHYSNHAIAFAKAGGFDLCVGGHDHRFRVETYGTSLFINPGNTVTKDVWLLDPKAESESSFVVLSLHTFDYEKIIVPH